MKVFILQSRDVESEAFIGAFSSLDKAADYIETEEGSERPEWHPAGSVASPRRVWASARDSNGEWWQVTEWEVDEW